MRKSLTDKGVAVLKPRAERYAFPDPEMVGHYVRVQPSGARAFVAVARTPAGKQIWTNVGACAADYVLNVFSSIANWHARRVDDYVPPIVKGMRRQSTKEQARERILTDAEIRLAWTAAADAGMFGAIVKLLLLTGQRMTRV